jgi:hypothetical protein
LARFPLLELVDHFVRVGKTTSGRLRKHESAVGDHVELTRLSHGERYLGADLFLEHRRETRSAGLVASSGAVVDDDVHAHSLGSLFEKRKPAVTRGSDVRRTCGAEREEI